MLLNEPAELCLSFVFVICVLDVDRQSRLSIHTPFLPGHFLAQRMDSKLRHIKILGMSFATRRQNGHTVVSSVSSVRRSKRVKILQLMAYTMSTMVFGMICSALGPSIPWLASNADVEPEMLGWLPAAQAVMCIVSGLTSSLMTFVPRRYHHYLLCGLLMWLGVFFMVLPSASLTGLYALALVFAFQVLPRPWIGQMTNLLVSELYDDASLSSAAQSFNQGWVYGWVEFLEEGDCRAYQSSSGLIDALLKHELRILEISFSAVH